MKKPALNWHEHAGGRAAARGLTRLTMASTPPTVGATGSFHRPTLTTVAIAGVLVLMLASQALSQPPTVPEQPLVIEGRVLWIDFGSQTLALAPADGNPAITIDLHRIRQSNYHGLRGNEYVQVVGFILRPSRRIQAFAIYLVSPWFPTEPQSP
jgi:hypothetical protein